MKHRPLPRDQRMQIAAGPRGPSTFLAAAFLIAATTLTLPISAQVSTASLSVRVVESDEPLPGVTVEVINPETGLQRTGITDESGIVQLQALPPGTYEIAAQLEGMITPESEVFQLMVGQRAQLTVTLRPQVTDAIEVTGDAPLVDVYKMDSSTNIIPEQIQILPVRDRQYERLVFITPGTQRDRSTFFNRTGAPVAGANSNSAAMVFLMDGADFTDSYFGLARVRVSQDAIEEFRVIAHRFDTEIGGSAGGAISVVTKSGGNSLRGSAFGFYRADSMRSKGALEESDVDFTRYHLGFTLGGPILIDKAHYFLSAEHIVQNDAAFFRPGGAFIGLAEDIPHPLRQNLALLSLDYQFGPFEPRHCQVCLRALSRRELPGRWSQRRVARLGRLPGSLERAAWIHLGSWRNAFERASVPGWRSRC